jgi:hypothetical protein
MDNDKVIYPPSAIFPQSLLVKSARKKVLRYNNMNASAETRGRWMGQYLLYKMEKHDVAEKLKKSNFAKVRRVLEQVDRDYINQEFLGHKDQTFQASLAASHHQVSNFRVLHHSVRDMESAGTPFLHHWLNTLVDGVLKEKIYYDSFYLTTPKCKNRKWVDCEFHEDVVGPEEWEYKEMEDKTTMSLYFPVGNTAVLLDMEHIKKKMGRPRKKMIVTFRLEPGDILFFDTSAFRHRTSRPEAGSGLTPRVNIILTGYRDVAEFD